MRTYHELSSESSSDIGGQVERQHARVRARLSRVRRVVPVVSGKGGVGKSFVAAALATALRRAGHEVGLLDSDLTGATAARFLGVGAVPLAVRDGAVCPLVSATGVKLMSMELLIREDRSVEWEEPDSASFVWRGAQERAAVREFLSDVEWGKLDYLIIDTPPGEQRLVDIAELISTISGCVAVTLPSLAAGAAVERALRTACRREIRILGVVENMHGYVCADCGGVGALFAGEAGSRLAELFGVPLLGTIPFDPDAARLADGGDMDGVVAAGATGTAITALADAVDGLTVAADAPEARADEGAAVAADRLAPGDPQRSMKGGREPRP